MTPMLKIELKVTVVFGGSAKLKKHNFGDRKSHYKHKKIELKSIELKVTVKKGGVPPIDSNVKN